MGNRIRTVVLLTGMTLLIMLIGRAIGGVAGMFFALILAAGMNFFSYWYSDKIVLKMYNAHEVTAQDAPDIYYLVERLTSRANLPMPKLFIIPEHSPNAFATGRDPEHAVVAVTQGLLELMDRDEIEGVLAHELAHVKNRDILIGSIAATMAGAIMMVANMAKWSAIFGMGSDDDEGGLGFVGLILMSIIAPIAAMIIQMAISRSREYLADSTGAQIVGHQHGLAGALEKLGAYSRQVPMHDANPSTAHMFIVNPLAGGSLLSLFSTHPPLEKRIAKLRGVTPVNDDFNSDSSRGSAIDQGKAFWDKMSR